MQTAELVAWVSARNHVPADPSGTPLPITINNEPERRLARHLMAEVRNLGTDRQHPDLLSLMGNVLRSAGLFAEAKEMYDRAAAIATEGVRKASEYHKAYLSALEQRKWSEALESLRHAVLHDSTRFAPFPVHQYEAEAILGAGGFGTAFLCRDRYMGRRVVVKAMHAADLDREPEEVFAEARTLDELSRTHSGIVAARSCGYADPATRSRPFLVLDHFDAPSLQALLDRGERLPLEDYLAVARQVAGAMAAAHCAGIVHRDLTPANVLARKGGDGWEARVIDFGLAVRVEVARATVDLPAGQRTLREAGMAGTWQYAAPEQIGESAETVGPHSDIYSFGRLSYALLLGRPTCDDEERETLFGSLRKLLSECTSWKPEKRPADFTAVLARLDSIAQAAFALRLKIVTPGREGTVPLGWVDVKGTYAGKPVPGVLLFHKEGVRYYPQERVQFLPDGTWSGKVHVGGQEGQRSAILVVAVDEALQKDIEEVYEAKGRATGVWKPYEWPRGIPAGVVLLDQVEILKRGDRRPRPPVQPSARDIREQCVGNWRWRTARRTVEFHLAADGTFTATHHPDETPSITEGAGLVKDGKGFWTVEGDRLTITMTHAWALFWVPYEVKWMEGNPITAVNNDEITLKHTPPLRRIR